MLKYKALLPSSLLVMQGNIEHDIANIDHALGDTLGLQILTAVSVGSNSKVAMRSR